MTALALRCAPLLAVAAVASLGGAALADELHASCSVRVIKASQDGEGIDPRITRMREYLQKPPLNAWKKFTLLDEKDVVVAPKATNRFDLPNGRHASLSYVDHVLTPQGKHRLRLHLEIADSANSVKKLLNTTFVLDEGGVVLSAGQKYQNGLLILGFSCDIPND